MHRALLVPLLGGLLLAAGCRTTSSDLQRWASREQGPAKLIAVLLHDKYPLSLRVEAALTLVSMKPRPGQQPGVDRMMESLLSLSEGERARVVSDLVPQLIVQMNKPPPARIEQGDPTVPFKDAAYALLTHEDKTLIANAATRTQVDRALTQWATTGFAQRLDDTTQKYGVVQVMKHLGADGVAALPDLIQPGVNKLDQISALLAELGSPASKLAGSQKLVALAQNLESERWLADTQQALLRGPLPPSPASAKERAVAQQTQDLMQVFGSMKRLGQAPTVEYLLGLAADVSKPEERRAAALAALEGNLESKRGPQLARLHALVDDERTPMMVRDLALRRMADLPRAEVVEDLYDLFDSSQWKTRWLSAELVLRMSGAQHLEEFMSHLKPVRKLAMPEVKRYGALLAELKGTPEIAQAISKYLSVAQPPATRLTALAYYLASGSSADARDLARHERDATPIPHCEDGPECAWQCGIERAGQIEEKELRTVGDFVQFCVLPVLSGRPTNPPPGTEATRPVQ